MLVELQALDKLRIPEWIKEILRDFIVKVKNSLDCIEVYLFGGYARGNWLYDSDIDLIVASPVFKNLNMSERYVLIRRMLPSIVSVELLLYTPEEFEKMKRKSIVIQDAEEYWVKLL